MGQGNSELAKVCYILIAFMYLHLINHVHEENCLGAFLYFNYHTFQDLPGSKKLNKLLEGPPPTVSMQGEPRQKLTSVSKSN